MKQSTENSGESKTSLFRSIMPLKSQSSAIESSNSHIYTHSCTCTHKLALLQVSDSKVTVSVTHEQQMKLPGEMGTRGDTAGHLWTYHLVRSERAPQLFPPAPLPHPPSPQSNLLAGSVWQQDNSMHYTFSLQLHAFRSPWTCSGGQVMSPPLNERLELRMRRRGEE